jgi:BCD family chlorophyll transporter-like MFS transporter
VKDFGWPAILRLGMVQSALGSIVVLTTSTLNRVMVVELSLPALLPGLLVGLHYAVQITRPRMGHGSDTGGRSTPWIIGGMVVLALGGLLAAVSTAWMSTQPLAGIAMSIVAFAMVGLGVGASGTALLVLLAKRVPADRRAAAATAVWMMMIAGFAVTAGVAGRMLDPYSAERLVLVSAVVSSLALVLTLIATFRLEGVLAYATASARPAPAGVDFREALRQVWAERTARNFTIFVFVSMLAYSAQDLILEPFAGSVFGFTPGASTQLSGVQHAGVLLGMLLVAASSSVIARRLQILQFSLRAWTIGGCIASGLALAGLALAGVSGPPWPFKLNVFLLGITNGAFSIAAIGSMMRLANEGGKGREGVRMGLWGAAQALAFGIGGVLGSAASDVSRMLLGSTGAAYSTVFAIEGLMFCLAAALAARVAPPVGVAARPVAASIGHAQNT